MLLLHDNLVVGTIIDAFQHQGTWFGSFQCSLPADCPPPTARLLEFIQFCQDWTSRRDNAHASEFDRFRDIVSSTKWRVLQPDGAPISLNGAPMFFDGCKGEVSWTTVTNSNDSAPPAAFLH